MKKRTHLKSAAALFAVLFAISLLACGHKYDEGEIRDAAKNLIGRSGEINEIYFGDGIPLADEDDYAQFAPWATPPGQSEDGEDDDMTYYMVKPDCGYSSIEDIKKATLRVYTEDYADILFSNAFSGVTVVVGEGDQAEKQLVSLARYIDSEEGYLAGRIPSNDEKLSLGRVYDLDGISVVSQRGSEAVVSVPSTSPDGETEEIKLTLKMTSDGWRLDTPTY